MIPSCCPWKVVTFFGKEHVNWSSINGVMIGRSLNIKFGKLKIGVTKKKWIFPNLIFQLHPIITQLILNQFACSLPKTNTTFHQLFKYVKKEEIFSSIRGENSRNIFGPCSTRGTVKRNYTKVVKIKYFKVFPFYILVRLSKKARD